MQHGFAVLQGKRVADRYCSGAAEGEHGSLAYGVGWCQTESGSYAAVTASFYSSSIAVVDWDVGT